MTLTECIIRAIVGTAISYFAGRYIYHRGKVAGVEACEEIVDRAPERQETEDGSYAFWAESRVAAMERHEKDLRERRDSRKRTTICEERIQRPGCK